MKAGGSGDLRTTHVRLMVLSVSIKSSGPPRISVTGSERSSESGQRSYRGHTGVTHTLSTELYKLLCGYFIVEKKISRHRFEIVLYRG